MMSKGHDEITPPVSPSALSEDQGRPFPPPYLPSVLSLLDEALEKYPDNIAVVANHQSSDYVPVISKRATNGESYLRWTYRQLSDAADIFAAALAHHGLDSGDTIVHLLHNSCHWPTGVWAALRMGCPWGGISPNEAGLAELMQHKLKICNAKALFVWDDEVAKALEKSVPELVQGMKLKIIANPGSGVSGWTYFDELMSSAELHSDKSANVFHGNTELLHDPERMIFILFTSGTTALPKGVPHTNRTMASCARTKLRFAGSKDSVIMHLPLFHVYAQWCFLGYLFAGSKVVIGSKSFEPGTTLEMIDFEKITHIIGSPTLMTAMFNHSLMPATDFSSVNYVIIGGTLIQATMINRIRKEMGCEDVCIAYGLTEGAPTIQSTREEKPNMNKDFVSCGKVAEGCFVRICEPGTRNVIPRGEIGEIHMGGAMVIRNYLAVESEDLYDENGTPWMATGDQGKMYNDGQIEVIGRYKDLIIRGGENLSPGATEAAANLIDGVEVQVVGAPDEIAGEVPIAVVKMTDANDSIPAHGISNIIREKLGNLHNPAEIMDVRDLDLDDFPRTSIGKVQKFELAIGVRKLLESREEKDVQGTQEARSVVISLWCRLLGQSQEHISTNTSIFDLADSITTMQFCNKIEKEHGFKISVQELVKYETIEEQVQFLESQHGSNSKAQEETPVLPPRDGPPTAADMVHTRGDVAEAEKTRGAIQPVLERFGLSWDEDVEDVLPLYDWGQTFLERRRPQSWNHRHAFVVANVDAKELRSALEKAFTRHPSMRTLSTTLDDGTSLQFSIRPSAKWFNLTISEGHEIKADEELPRLKYNDPELDFAAEPGPMVRCMITKIGDTGRSGFVLNLQHSVFDGYSMQSFLDSLDAFLQTEKPSLPPITPYKLFADLYYQYKTSVQADTAIALFTRQLAGISENSNAIWPQQRAPGWFKGNDVGWTHPDGTPGKPSDRPILDGSKAQGANGIKKSCIIPGLIELRRTHGITAPVLFKSALALLNVSLNGTRQAQFSNYDAARSWPFLPSWIANRLPNAMSIDGSIVACLYNSISIPPNQTVSEFLNKASDQQKQDSTHAHVPYFRLLSALSKADSQHLSLNMTRQIFNWLPGFRAEADGANPFKEIKRVQQQSRSDVMILWNCGMVGEEEFLMNASYDDAQLYATEVEEAIEKLFVIAKWLCEEGNWEKELKLCPV